MPNFVSEQDAINQAVALKGQALGLMNKDGAAEADFTEAERLMKEAEDLVSRSSRLADLRNRADQIKAGDPNQHGDATPRQPGPASKFAHFGEFLLAIKSAQRGAPDSRLNFFESEHPASDRGGEAKDLSELSGASGGFLVPTEFRAQLMAAVVESSIVRPRSMIIPMARRSIEVPALKQSGTTAGQPHWFGGMIAYWEAEAQTLETTEPAFRNVVLTAHDLTAVTHASNNLLADSAISLSALLTGDRGFPGVVAWKEDYAFLRGSGSGEPLGVLTSPATIAVARAGSGHVTYTDLVNMMGKLLPSSKAVWVASIAMKAELMLMAGPTATNYAGMYLWGDASKGIPDSLLGYPIYFTEKVPALGTRGDISLIDFSHYYIGDRQSTTVDSTDQARWLRNQTSWKVTHRVDGQPWLDTYFTLADGTTTVSPFVTLAT